jgi:VanZ family protein
MYWLLPISWMGIIFFFSSQPYENQDIKPLLSNVSDLAFLEPYVRSIHFTYHHTVISTEALGINGFVEFFIRKGAHFTAFFILMLLITIAIRNTTSWKMRMQWMVSFLITAAYAISDELHQGLTPNRTPYFGDVLIDVLGAFIACLVFIIRARGSKAT